jgi:hypothetical protein
MTYGKTAELCQSHYNREVYIMLLTSALSNKLRILYFSLQSSAYLLN